MPSLSVVHAEPSSARKLAPALSSPPKPTEPSMRPGTNHLNPTGTSHRRRPREAATRSIIELETSVLPIAASGLHPSRWVNRYWIATARKWFGFISPPSGVTMPCRSASASLPVSRSNSLRFATTLAIAEADEGSMRIFSSQSSVMNDQVGSTAGFTTVRSSPNFSAISCQ